MWLLILTLSLWSSNIEGSWSSKTEKSWSSNKEGSWSSNTEGSQYLTAADQLPRYNASTKGHYFNLTDDNGTPVEGHDISELNSDFLDNNYKLRSLLSFSAERVPTRALHTKGAGAFGYFEVTNDISDICKAKFLSKKGKKTKVVVRFSNQLADVGEADTTREAKGFSVKFYTEEGNMDMICLNFPVFSMKNSAYFAPTVHALKRNPETRLLDKNSRWDFLTLRNESILFTMYTYGDSGVPNGFRHITGWPIHTFQLYNDKGEVSYVRFRLYPHAGIENLPSSEATRLAGEDPDYYARDLYEAILNRNYPTWTLAYQYMSKEDIKLADFNPFDTTLMWPEEDYPFNPIGKLVLNENLKNHFAENELLSFCPTNLVPGISGGADKLYQSRRFAYQLAALHRLGPNAYKIKVNCPIMSQVHTYFRDGNPPVGDNEGNAPNYFPNDFGGPKPNDNEQRPYLIKPYVDPKAQNFGQARDLYENGLTEPERQRMIDNIVSDLGSGGVIDSIKKRVIKYFAAVHPEFAQRIIDGLKNANATVANPTPIKD